MKRSRFWWVIPYEVVHTRRELGSFVEYYIRFQNVEK